MLGGLALGMSEFVMVDILSDIARSLGVSIAQTGYLIPAYAPGVCFGTLLTVLVVRTRPLKQMQPTPGGMNIFGQSFLGDDYVCHLYV